MHDGEVRVSSPAKTRPVCRSVKPMGSESMNCDVGAGLLYQLALWPFALLFPVSVPLIIGAVKATALAFGAASDGYPWLGLVLAFDAIFLAVSFAVFEFVIED